jgi:hypothetical protein
MKKENTRFAFGFTLYSLVIGALSFGVAQWFPQLKITQAYPYILLFFYLFTLFTTLFTLKSLHDKLSRFTNIYMIVNFMKLLLFSMIILVYAWLNRADAGSFVITFFVYYLFFTAYEVVILNRANRKE